MAESAASDSLSCSVCLDVLKNPVTLPCAHSYCMECINGYWDQEDQRGACSCPQCRQKFSPRPVLNRNTLLADLMVNMAERGKPTPPLKNQVGSGDVECDFCTVKKRKAVKSCLVCLASYCATHLQPHYESAAFKRHQLVEVSTSLQEKICSKHDKLLEVYCRTDDQCICLLCVIDEHKGHDTVSAATEREEKQQKFRLKKQKFQQGVQEKGKQLRQLKQNMNALQCSRDAALSENEKAYAEMVMLAGKRHAEMKELIREKEKAAMSRAEGLVDRIEREIRDLRRREDVMKQLTQTEDHIYFLQQCKPIFDTTEPEASSDSTFRLHTHFDFVTKAIADLKGKMELVVEDIEQILEKIKVDLDPKTRQEFSMYSCSLSLDPNTAFENLLISEGNKKVTWVKKAQEYPYHPERFNKYDQVLCCEGLSGLCYWEVEWKGPRVEVAVCYKGAKLEESCFGYTDQSWCVSISNSGCHFWHNEVKTRVPTPCSSTVGVYLNQKAGILSFYSVPGSGQMMLLHRVQSSFTQPLFAGFMLSKGASVRIITP